MLTLRKILFYLFCLIYAVVCPLIIMYALGITFKPGEKHLQKTGIIYLSTIPSSATISVNGQKIQEKTPTAINNLSAGKYLVRIFYPAYKPFEKTLPVAEEKATTAEDILLIPEQWKTLSLTNQPFQNLIPFKNQPFILVTTGNLLQEFFIYHWPDNFETEILETNNPFEGNLESLIPINSIYREARVIKYFTSPETPYVLFQINLDGKIKFLWTDLSKKVPSIEDVTDLFPLPCEEIAWNKHIAKNLFTTQEGSMNRLDVDAKAIYPNITTNIKSFSFYKDRLYVLTKNLVLNRLDSTGRLNKVLLNDTALSHSFFADSEKIKIVVVDDDMLFFLRDDGALISNRLPHTLIEKGVKGIYLQDNAKHVLIWTKDKIGVLDLSEKNEENIFEQGLQVDWLNVNADLIEQAFFINNGRQILFVDQNKVFITETKNFGEMTKNEIVSIKKGSYVNYSDKNGRLFYLDEKTAQLSSVEIIPQSSLLSFPGRKDQKENTSDQ